MAWEQSLEAFAFRRGSSHRDQLDKIETLDKIAIIAELEKVASKIKEG